MIRTSILRGPAIVQFGGQTFYSQSDITIRMQQTAIQVSNSLYGKLQKRKNEIMHTISFTPDGRWAALAVLFPYASALIGSSVFGGDSTLTIWTLSGLKRVYKAGAVTKMPSIMASAGKTLFGPVEFTCLHAESSNWSDANSLFTDSNAAYPGDAGYNPHDILVQPYTLDWGADAPWDSFGTKDGVTIDFELELSPETTDNKGIIDYTFQDLVVSAKFIPEGITDAQVRAELKHQGAGAVRGAAITSDDPLNIVGTGVYIRLNGAAPTDGNEAYGNTARRVGELTFEATRIFADGAPKPLFFVGAANPDTPPEEP